MVYMVFARSRKMNELVKMTPRKETRTKPKGKSRTRQSHAAECDINNIIKKFQKTGALDHVAKHGPIYGDVTAITYHEAQNLVIEADEMFHDLPSSVRAKFENDPRQFMDFVQDDENLEEMSELGLLTDEASERLRTVRAAKEAADGESELPPVEPEPVTE